MSALKNILTLFIAGKRAAFGIYYKILITCCGGAVGKGLRVDGFISFKYPPHRGICIGNCVSVGKSVCIDVPERGSLILEDRVKLNSDIVLAARDRVVIGSDTLIGEYSSVRDSDHGIDLGLGAIRTLDMVSSAVLVGPDTWIGRGVAVLKGVEIGAGAVIGANAVVTKSIPPYSIAIGVPAKVVRFRKENGRNSVE